MDGREDYQKELEIITAMLRAWVEEKAFLNARMAVNIAKAKTRQAAGYNFC